jgi:arginyl-tRNA synthetase
LFELYVKITAEAENDSSMDEKIRQEFKELSEGNKDSISLWQKFTRYSIDAMQIQLNRLHIKPDFDI